MPTGTGSSTVLIGDFSKAAIIQTEGLSVNFYEQDSDNVQRNLITAKVEARVALAVLRPDAFVFF
jgi:HK97 family phage major capsid protein